MRIRPATSNDAPALTELAQATYTQAFGPSMSAEDLAAHLTLHLSLGAIEQMLVEDVVFVAEVEERLIGFVQCGSAYNIPEVSATDQEIRRLYVQAEYQHQGFGSQLLTTALAHPSLNTAERIFLDVWEHNPGARRLYERFGFMVIGERQFEVESGAEASRDWLMVRRQRRQRVVLDAPSNLGLRPPETGSVPGCYKLPWALRDRNLLSRIGATDSGSVVPPRYRALWVPGDGVRNAEAIAQYSVELANRLTPLFVSGQQVIVLGGDCSVLIGNTLALKRRGRYGLVFLDAHSDFRHLGNAPALGAAAGEDLAIVTGRGDARLIDLEGRRPYVNEADVHLVGVRASDDCLEELTQLGVALTTSEAIRSLNVQQLAEQVWHTVTQNTIGFWIHWDVDVVDASEMSAVDCPEDAGPSFAVMAELLRHWLGSPQCVGLEVTIYDPDLDPTGEGAERIVRCLEVACGKVASH